MTASRPACSPARSDGGCLPPAVVVSFAVTLLASCLVTPTANAQRAADLAPDTMGESVAVLPFRNITGASRDDWIAAGIAETLTTDLQGAAGVDVISRALVEDVMRTTGFAADGPATDGAVLEVGRRVGARWVVSGGYQRRGDQLRITGRLVDVATRSVVRSAKVDGVIDDLFMLQDRLAAELSPRPPAGNGTDATDATGAAELAHTSNEPVNTAVEPLAPAAPLSPPTASRGGGFAVVPTSLIDGPPAPVAPDTITRDAVGRATVRAVRLNGSLRLDGVLDEAIYAEVPSFGGFIQQLPNAGEPGSEQTEAWVFSDAQNVYVSARLWDSAPESEWVANDMQRDSFQIAQSDTFSVVFDTFYDRRNGVAFMVNPIGGFLDFQITDEGNPNLDWNPIWDVRTGRFDGGWTVEMQFPFKSLRFRPTTSQIWGVQLGRQVRRKNEATHLTPVPINAGPGELRVSAAGTLIGIEVPQGSRTFEVKPYAIGSLATDVNAVPRLSNVGDGDFGVDVKYGVTDNLTADFTYNTDFAQVEVDEQQVNLTRFSLFFPEKREFFLEGRGIFDFGRAAGVRMGGGGGGGGGFFGGGDVPTIFFSRRIGLNEGREVPILGGGRVTGKVGAFSIGALNIQTDDAAEAAAVATNFTVVRLKRDILRRSRVGMIFTERSVSTVGDGSNEAYGLDAAFSFYDNVNFSGYYARTRSPDLVGDDTSYQAAFNYTGDLYAVQVDHLLVGDHFNPEIGFLRRDDFRRTFVEGQYSPRPRSIQAVRQFTWTGSLDYILNGENDIETRVAKLRFNTELENSDRLGVAVQRNYELLVQPFQIASDVAIPVGGYGFQDVSVSYFLGAQRRISGNLTFQRGGFFSGDITAVGYQRGRVEITPKLSISPSVSINRIDLPEGRFTATLVTNRVIYTLTPRTFVSGLVQYTSASNSLSTNLRLRWEYRPGSELFVVYNDQRDTTLSGTPVLENRAFVVKLTRLFRF